LLAEADSLVIGASVIPDAVGGARLKQDFLLAVTYPGFRVWVRRTNSRRLGD
jgi:hypothetical protein